MPSGRVIYPSMVDPVLAAVVLAVSSVSGLAGIRAGAARATAETGPSVAAGAGSRSLFRRGVLAAIRPAILVWLPLALLGTVVVLVIGRGGGPPPDVVILGEIFGVISILALVVGCATATGSVLAMTVRARWTS